MKMTEIKIQKKDLDDIDDFTLNMGNYEINSNMTDTPQDSSKSVIKEELIDENETIDGDIQTPMESGLFCGRFEEEFVTLDEGKKSWCSSKSINDDVIENPELNTVIKHESDDQVSKDVDVVNYEVDDKIDVIATLEIDYKLEQSGASKFKSTTGKSKYECNICGKTFTRANYLKKHFLIHTGEKPFHCPICNNYFSRSSHLTRHLVTHSGVQKNQK